MSHESGFSLIEGMLAAMILAIGVLALAGMQGMALGRNIDANELTVATNLAADMMERIHLNRRNVATYHGINTTVAGTQPALEPARGDYTQWQTRLANSTLTNVVGTVSVAAVGPTVPPLNQNEVTLQIRWRGSMKSDTSSFMDRVVTFVTIVAPE